MSQFINLTIDNIDKQHLCCAISDKKHQDGVSIKKEWLREKNLQRGIFSANSMKKEKYSLSTAPLEKSLGSYSRRKLFIYLLSLGGRFI